MEGFGFTADLDPQRRRPSENVMIFNGRMVPDGGDGGGVGAWAPLQPGFGLGFATDGATNTLSDRFGPELSFGQDMAAGRPSDAIALIKYARGGSALALATSGFGSWDPDYSEGNSRNQYDNALTAIRLALAPRDIDNDGRVDRLVPAGIVWMQGEADAYDNPAAAAAYQANLKRMIELLRAALRVDDLPVVIGLIADSRSEDGKRIMAHFETVQAAQRAFVRTDACAALVSETQAFSFLPDRWHYQSAHYVELGSAFATAMTGLQVKCGHRD